MNDTLEPLLLAVKDVCALTGIGRTLWLSMAASGRTPAPVKLGRRSLWRRPEIEAWINAGCPSRDKWEAMQTNAPKTAKRWHVG